MSFRDTLRRAALWEWILFGIAALLLAHALGCLHGCAAAGQVVKKAESKGTVILISTVVAGGVGLLVGVPALPLLLVGAVSSTTTIVLQDDPVSITVEDGAALSLGGKQDANQLRDMIAKARAAGVAEGAREKDSWWSGFVRKLKLGFGVVAFLGFVWLRRRWLWKWVREKNWAALWHAVVASEKSRARALKE